MNVEVSQLLNNLDHPFRKEIDELRALVLATGNGLEENIKWNGPNYSVNGADRITIRVNPPPAFSLILHMGTKAQKVPAHKIEDHGILTWKSIDRAVVDFKDKESFERVKIYLVSIVRDWVANTL